MNNPVDCRKKTIKRLWIIEKTGNFSEKKKI